MKEVGRLLASGQVLLWEQYGGQDPSFLNPASEGWTGLPEPMGYQFLWGEVKLVLVKSIRSVSSARFDGANSSWKAEESQT